MDYDACTRHGVTPGYVEATWGILLPGRGDAEVVRESGWLDEAALLAEIGWSPAAPIRGLGT